MEHLGLTEEDANYRAICSRLTLQSKKEGFFKQLSDSLASNVNFPLFFACQNDLERIKVVAASCWDQINAELIFRGKNKETSVEKRLEGNKYFEKNELKKALLFYTQSLIQAPVGPELASTYNNRSALLFKLGDYQESIDDAELAISYGSPEETKHKLYERMTACYIGLKNFTKAKVTHRLAKHLTEKHDKSNDKLLKKLEKHLTVIEKCLKEQQPSKSSQQGQTKKIPDGISLTSVNLVFPSSTKKLSVDYNDEAGRFAFANERISTGEVILYDEPFASCLYLEKMGSHCTHCFVRFKVPIPCETCSHVAFCSRKCRKEAQDTYHRYECKVFALLMGSGMSVNVFLALRIITQSSVEHFKEIFPFLQNDYTQILLDKETGKYDTKSYQNIYNLGGLEDYRTPLEFYERALMSVFLMKCLRLNNYFEINLFKNPKPTEEELMIGSLILRNLQVLQFNAYEVCEFLMESKDNYRKTTTSSLGLAIYPMASYFNHSCAPDVTRYFCGNTMVIQAIKGINPLKPICDNYGPMFTKHERKDRRRKLLGRYWFSCECAACEFNYPLLNQFPLEITASDDIEEKKALKKLVLLEKQFWDEGMKAMDVGKPYAAIELFKRFIDEYEGLSVLHEEGGKFARNPYKTMLLAQEGIKLCLCSLGNVFVAGTGSV